MSNAGSPQNVGCLPRPHGLGLIDTGSLATNNDAAFASILSLFHQSIRAHPIHCVAIAGASSLVLDGLVTLNIPCRKLLEPIGNPIVTAADRFTGTEGRQRDEAVLQPYIGIPGNIGLCGGAAWVLGREKSRKAIFEGLEALRSGGSLSEEQTTMRSVRSARTFALPYGWMCFGAAGGNSLNWLLVK